MRLVGRILIGAALALVGAVSILVVLLVVLEGFRVRYDDLTLAYVMFLTLICLPITGGWWGWVRNRRAT